MKHDLDPNWKDHSLSVVKGSLSVLAPVVGPMISEVLTVILPDFRINRLVKFIKMLEREFENHEGRLTNLENFKKNASTEQGSELCREGLVQASQTIEDDRKKRLARLLARSLSAEDLKYAQTKLLLSIYEQLTDPEIVLLIGYSYKRYIGEYGPNKKWREKHPEVYRICSIAPGTPKEELIQGAFQNRWKHNLVTLGLTSVAGHYTSLTLLGRLLVGYIIDSDDLDVKMALL